MSSHTPEERYRSTVLSNGLTVLTYTDLTLEVADLSLVVRCGYRFERPDELGFAHFLEHMLLKGTTRCPTPELLAAEVERLGGYRNAYTSVDSVCYVVQVAAEYAESMVGFLAEIMFQSLLDSRRTEEERGPILQELRRAIGDHHGFLARRAREEFFRGHPLERTILRTEKSTNDTTADRLRSHMRRLYGADRSALVVSSSLLHEAVCDKADSLFGTWPRATEEVVEQIPFVPRLAAYVHESRETPQTFVSLSYPGPIVADLRMNAAVVLATEFLSYGGSSLLMSELRYKRALVYWASAAAESYPDAGRIEFGTATENPQETVAIASGILEDLCQYLRPEHVEPLKIQVLGAYKRRFASSDSRVRFMRGSFVEHQRLVTPQEWLEELRRVTYADILELATLYLRSEHAVLVTLGPGTGIQ